MAQRRMFSLKIIDTDIFLDMPLSAQALYFHLGMRADDEGFIGNPKKIMRMIGAREDDFNILRAKEMLICYENGIIVISHWHIHNYIQKDRFTPSLYTAEKQFLLIQENKSYQKCIQPVSKLDTQIREGKDRVEIEKEFNEWWAEYPKKRTKAKARELYVKLKSKAEMPTLIDHIDTIRKWKMTEDWKKENGQYIPYPTTWLNQKRWEDEIPMSKTERAQRQGELDIPDDMMELCQ